MPESKPSPEITIDYNVAVPMRDGTVLRADVYRPKKDGKYPVIVSRDVYDHSMERFINRAMAISSHGYVYVLSNCRGRLQSDGVFVPLVDDGWGANRDGYDTIEWAAKQPWSDGNVAMDGLSYATATQYLTVPTRPPSLKTCFAAIGWCASHVAFFTGGANPIQFHRGWAINGVVLQDLPSDGSPADMQASRQRLEKVVEDWASWMDYLPLKEFPPLEGLAPWFFDHLDHPSDGPWWWRTDVRTKFHEIDVPMLHLGGWFDDFLSGALAGFTGIREKGRSAKCRDGQRLVIGPWIHSEDLVIPNRDFGDEAVFDMHEYALRWFDYWLKGVKNGVPDDPPVRVFLMGENRWLELQEWPPAGVMYKPIYLREGKGKTKKSLNNGALTFSAPVPAERPDSYSYDPLDPVPFKTPAEDRRSIEGRLLTYTTDLLEEPVTIVGPVKAVLYALSSAPDTDWVVRLCDVWPDGRSMCMCDGILRARYRDSLEHEELMVPGQIYRFVVDMVATAQRFLAGHRIRVQVTSSDFPRYDRNLNTGGPFGEEVRGQVAINTIFHDAIRPSHVLLPLMGGSK